MIKHIIFDLGGVLIDLDMPRCLEGFRALGVDPTVLLQPSAESAQQGRARATLCDGLVANGAMDLYQTGDISTPDFVAGIQRYCTPGTTGEQVLQAWNDCLLNIPAYKLEFIKSLRDQGYSVHLLSNTNDAHWQHIAEKHFGGKTEDYFDTLFLSQEMHMSKPNNDIFIAVLDRLGVKAEECLFIDDAQANVDAAQALGYNVYKAPVQYDFRREINQILNPMTYTSTIIVAEQHLACTVGSGDLPVLATPMMVALMENAAMLCVQPELAEDESTVGSQIAVSHVKPTALGKNVSAKATLLSREGRKLTFHVEAHDEDGLIGEGEHTRYIINKEKFLSKLKSEK